MKPKYLHDFSKDESTTIKEVFEDLVYAPEWFQLDGEKIKTVVDVGALIGSFSLWIHEKIPKAKIFAYEPDPESYNYLLKNIKQAKAEKQIQANNFAVWEREEKLSLHRFENTFGSNSVIFKNRPFVGKYQETIKVDATSLKNIISKVKKIDLLKLDCEGSEYNILYSLDKKELKKIKYIVLEYHEFDNEKIHTGNALSNFLRKNNFITQIIPTNIKNHQGLGYIYASQVLQDTKLQKIFDQSTKSLLNLHKILNEREEYAKDLEKTILKKDDELGSIRKNVVEKENYAKELEGVVSKKESYAKELEGVVSKKESYAKELEGVVSKKESYAKELEGVVSKKESYAKELEGVVSKKESYAKELEGVVSKKESYAKELEGVVSKKESYAKELELEIKLKDSELKKIEGIIIEGEKEISKLLDMIHAKELELIDFKNELSEIERSVMFQVMRKTGKRIDLSFPNNSRRGEFKKIVSASLSIIFSKGIKKYLSEVDTKFKRKEFKVLTPVVISSTDEEALKKIVNDNKKNRLKVNPHNKNFIENDEIFIPSEEKL